MKKQEQKGWAIFDPKGCMRSETFRHYKKRCIENFSDIWYSEYAFYGWTCRKVVITEI